MKKLPALLFVLAVIITMLLMLGKSSDAITLPQHKTDIYSYYTVYSDRVGDIIVVYQISIDGDYYTSVGCDSVQPDDNGHTCVLWGIDSIEDFIVLENLSAMYPNVKEHTYDNTKETTIEPVYQWENAINV